MRENAHTKLVWRASDVKSETSQADSAVCVLVPYERGHVHRYNEWMQSEELQELTASEPLSLDEEYAMQLQWREDADKLTFIIHTADPESVSDTQLAAGEGMVGDVNIFIHQREEDGEEEWDGITPLKEPLTFKQVGELEVMIAEVSARRSGLGWRACCMMLLYSHTTLGLVEFEAKIKRGNTASITMFTERLGFVKIKETPVFDEVTLALRLSSNTVADLREKLGKFDEATFHAT